MFVSDWSIPTIAAAVNSSSWKLKNISLSSDNMVLSVKADNVNVGTSNTAAVFQPLGADRPIVITEGYKGDKFSLQLIMHHADWISLNRLLAKNISLFLQSDT